MVLENVETFEAQRKRIRSHGYQRLQCHHINPLRLETNENLDSAIGKSNLVDRYDLSDAQIELV